MSEKNQLQSFEKQKMFSVQFLKVFLIEAFLFSVALLLGIATSFKINKLLKTEKIIVPQISFWQLLFQFALASSFIFLIVQVIKRKKQKKMIFQSLFVLAVFAGGTLVLSAWLSDLTSFLLMGFLLFWWWRWPSVFIQDVCVILSIAGAGSILGLTISPKTASFFLVIFSVYDIIAVYKTKHMVKMAKEMVESRAILGLVIPSNLPDFKSSLSEIKPGGRFLILGGGDVVLPLFLCSSIISSGQSHPLIVAVFSLIGVFFSFLFFIFQKNRQPIPALPPIAFFSIIGFLLTKIL